MKLHWHFVNVLFLNIKSNKAPPPCSRYTYKYEQDSFPLQSKYFWPSFMSYDRRDSQNNISE